MKREILMFIICLSAAPLTASPLLGGGAPMQVSHTAKGCLLELPKRLLKRDFVLAARVQSLSSTANRLKLSAGQRLYDPVWIRFRYDDHRLLVLKPDTKNRADSTVADGASYAAYRRNADPPVWKMLPVKQATDSTLVVDATAFFTEPLQGVDPFDSRTQPGRPIAALTRITDTHAHSLGVEVSVRYGFDGALNPFGCTVRKSLCLLPEQPMLPRAYDARVGYDYVQYRQFDAAAPSIRTCSYITRFRLEPAPADRAAYLRGKPVRPNRPIVFYIDPAFPKLWQEAIADGIRDWNKAFEAIGFKGVMVTKSYADGGKDFDPDDMRFNCFRYVVSDFQNAMGKHWVDPRTGEVLQADVLFYSNVLPLLRKWYFLQTAAYNPVARQRTLPDSVLHRILRYAAAHEIGHCLGLEHNFRASAAYPTESLRKPAFAESQGTTASIMDYARFNYVAQPGDGVKQVCPPLLGAYDYYTIKVGYAWKPQEDEQALRREIDAAQANPALRYGRMNPSEVPVDPSVQTSDLGDDPVASATYGIRNLRTIVEHIASWNKGADGNPFEGMPATLDDLRDNYFEQLQRVVPLIGGIYRCEASERNGVGKETFVPAVQSERAVDFLLDELTNGYQFLASPAVQAYAGSQTEALVKQQRQLLVQKMLSRVVLGHIARTQQATGFTLKAYLKRISQRLESGGQSAGLYLLNLRQAYTERLQELSKDKSPAYYDVLLRLSMEDQ